MSRKYKPKRHKIEHRNVNISDPNYIEFFYCNYCSRLLIPLNNSGGEESYYCNSCQSEQFPLEDYNKRKSRIITPSQNKETLVSTVPSGYEGVNIKKKTELKGSFLELSKKGIKIKNFREEPGR